MFYQEIPICNTPSKYDKNPSNKSLNQVRQFIISEGHNQNIQYGFNNSKWEKIGEWINYVIAKWGGEAHQKDYNLIKDYTGGGPAIIKREKTRLHNLCLYALSKYIWERLFNLLVHSLYSPKVVKFTKNDHLDALIILARDDYPAILLVFACLLPILFWLDISTGITECHA